MMWYVLSLAVASQGSQDLKTHALFSSATILLPARPQRKELPETTHENPWALEDDFDLNIYIYKIRLYQVLWSSSAYLSLKHAQLLEIQTAKIICKNDDHIQSCNHCRAEFSDDAFFVRQTKSRPLAAAKTPPAASEASASRCLRSATVDVRHLKLGNYMKGIRNTL